MRHPPSVLVDCEFESLSVRQISKLMTVCKVEDKRLLTQNMLACQQSISNLVAPYLRRARDIHHFDIIAPQDIAIIRVYLRGGKKFPTPGLGPLGMAVA